MGEVTKLHIRLVILGAGGSGKSAIIRRFLFNTFCDKHRPTVEDLFTKDFQIGTCHLKVSANKSQYISPSTSSCMCDMFVVSVTDCLSEIQHCNPIQK